MLDPRIVISYDLESSFFALGSPLIFKVSLVTNLASNRWNIVCCKHPIIHVSANLVTNDLFGIAIVNIILWELRFLSNFLENF